jgi:hypothetical protein
MSLRGTYQLVQRPLNNMKSQASLYALLIFALATLGALWFFFALEPQASLPVFSATIHRDCAPWDGSAFTVSIPVAKSVIGISIYQSPAIQLPVKFAFPDNTGQVGNALLFLPAVTPEPLIGKVSFQRIDEGLPVEGEFNLRTEMGQRFKGRFRAEWNRQPVYCG